MNKISRCKSLADNTAWNGEVGEFDSPHLDHIGP